MAHCFFWFRRDLRVEDNHGLWQALSSGKAVIPVFIFDTEILSELPADDKRVTYIYRHLEKLKIRFQSLGSDLIIMQESPANAWMQIFQTYGAGDIYTNEDYEPYARQRDAEIASFANVHQCALLAFKDQVVFRPGEVLKSDGSPYTIFTPFNKAWHNLFQAHRLLSHPSENSLQALKSLAKSEFMPPAGFELAEYSEQRTALALRVIESYEKTRDYPGVDGTSRISVALRFGTISIRECYRLAWNKSSKWVNELNWREFYMHILYHFPHVVNHSFKPQYDNIRWRNDTSEFEAWCLGKTGYPFVDAGMRELNATGFMHNRSRMVVASFLTKHLLIDWRWGEAYFAEKLMDFELSSNNGGWQWAAGCGVDAAPYFRIFNPETQLQKFDPNLEYVKKWIPEYGTLNYVAPIVDHSFARERCLATYKEALN